MTICAIELLETIINSNKKILRIINF
jgi:hypothetical protein